MADVKPYGMMDNIMSKTVADVFSHKFWQIVLYIVAYFGPHV